MAPVYSKRVLGFWADMPRAIAQVQVFSESQILLPSIRHTSQDS